MPYSVCVDNQNLVSVEPISIDWKTPFLKLFFDKEKARNKHFAENGQNWQYSDTDYSFKTTLLDVYLDQNDHITDITLYKYQSTSFNHGKNSSKELKVTASDIKENLAVLQEVVSDSSEFELEKLLSDVSQSEFGKERKFKVGKTSISIIDQNGNVQTIKRNTILKAIQISHKYLEILHNDKVFICSPKDFPEEIRPVLHEILSFVNAEKYYDLDALKYKMELRELVEQAEEDYPRLRQAVIDGDLEEVVKLAAYAKLKPSPDSGESALYFAVKNNNYDIVKVLLENGAYVLEIYSDGSHYPLEIAYTNGNQEMVRLLIEYHGAKDKVYSVFKHNVDNLLKICASKSDYETLNLMGPDSFQNEAGIWMKPEMFPDINNDETLQKISQYPEIRIAWKLDQIRPLYEKMDYDLCRNLLIQGSDKQVIEYFIAEDDLEMFKAALSRHTAFDAKGASFELAFERGREWYDCLCEHTTKTVLPNGRIAYGIEKALDRYYIKLLDANKKTPAPDNPLNDRFYKEAFQTLWKTINHKYAYTVDFDSEELIRKSIETIDKELSVSRLQYIVTVGKQRENITGNQMRENNAFGQVNTKTRVLKYGEGSQVKYDLIGKIASGSLLTRKTVAAILKGIKQEKFDMFKLNPEEFISNVIRFINEQKATMIVEHITYNTIEGEYESSIFTAEKSGRTVDQAFLAQKAIQNYVYTDGTAEKSVERKFAEALDAAEEVYIYAKLPRGFAIPTPVGNYSPDWAIVFHDGMVKHIYFVAETKGTMDSMELRPIEKAKIDCAKKLFNKLTNGVVTYDHVDSFQQLMNKVM